MTPTRSKREHKQVPILYEGEVLFSVDKKLQGLIQFFVDNEITTFNSCQDNVEGTCWIQYDLSDWIEILERSFYTESQDLYRFVEEECHVELLSSDDGYLDENDEFWIEGENLIWSSSVRFRKELLPTFEKFVRATLVDIDAVMEPD